MNDTHMTESPIAAITGASSGIGETFARALAEKGYDLILIARRLNRLNALAAELSEKYGVNVESLAADLADPVDLGRVAETLHRAKRLELLVNNAGFGTKPAFAKAEISKQLAMVRLHIEATTQLTHAALKPMLANDDGGIINVSSVAAWFQSPSNVMYCATKAWINSFTDGLAIELENTGVQVMALCPGFTYSEFHDVMEVSRDTVPKRYWLKAGFVVAEALKDFEKGKWLSIPGWRYKLIVLAARFMPRWMKVNAAKKRHRRGGELEGVAEEISDNGDESIDRQD